MAELKLTDEGEIVQIFSERVHESTMRLANVAVKLEPDRDFQNFVSALRGHATNVIALANEAEAAR